MRRRYSSREKVPHDSGRVKSFDFTSLSAFYAVADVARPAGYYQGDSAFEGATREESKNWRFAWPDGLERLADLPEFNIPRAKTARARRWSENDGDTMDMQRFNDGRAFMLQRYRPKTGKKGGGRVQLVRVNVGENCNVCASAMLWKAYAVGRLVEQLEAGGVRVAVDVYASASCFNHAGDSYLMRVPVKAPQDPLNLAAVVAVCTPWFLRRWVINHRTNLTGCLRGAGSSCKLAYDPAALTIDTGECLSREAAERWLKGASERAASAPAWEAGAL
jgi:hypothetical protein